ncbi:MAG: PQQ-binding-like beta-propeller repeat protein [Planctomycetota bacterium]
MTVLRISAALSLAILMATTAVAQQTDSAAQTLTSATSDVADSSEWSMWGGTINRNMISDQENITLDFDLATGHNVIWSARLGSQTYGNPVVAGDKVFVGTNNGSRYRRQIEGDKGIFLAFRRDNGRFLWQLTRDKLAAGRVNDWPLQGICSTPHIEGDRMWIVTNRCELMCLDTEGFYDDENDGWDEEELSDKKDADIIWNLDMIEELGVFPHNLATSSPVVYGDYVYLLTSNGVDEAHLRVPSPRAPCFLMVNKNTGEVIAENNEPFDTILHGQWGSPAIGVVNGKAQVYFPGGDGVLYALDAETFDEVWRFDLNPKETKWKLGGAGTRNAIIATPVFVDNSVLLSVGQDPEHGEGVGHLWRVDATKTGDISPELGDIGEPGTENPNSGVIWHYGGVNEEGEEIFRRTMSTVAISDNRVYAADLSGFIHCIDFETGERFWEYDMMSGVWGSPMVVDGKVFIGNEDGKLTVFKDTAEDGVKLAEFPTMNYSSIYSTPSFAGGVMYLSDRSTLYAVQGTLGLKLAELVEDGTITQDLADTLRERLGGH